MVYKNIVLFILLQGALLVGVLGAPVVAALELGDRVDNFRLMDHIGGSSELHYYADVKAVAIMAHTSRCEQVARNAQVLQALQTGLADNDLHVMAINSDLLDRRDDILTANAASALQTPILMDTTQIVGESLGLTKAAEVLVIDPDGWRLVYRGEMIGAQKVIEKLAGVETSNPAGAQRLAASSSGASNCTIDYPELADRSKHANISYAETIAPMLAENCVSCHREGGIGPWAMSDYNMVRGFAPMIREVVRTQRMPPWHADPHVGRFSNNRSLSDEEIRTLVHWIEAGAPRGDGTDLLAAMKRYWPQWVMGEPDVIIDIPPEQVPATGVVDYKYKMVQNPMSEDAWVKAVEIIPGDRAVLHHVITTFGELETEGRRAGRLKRGTGGGLGGYVPGDEGDLFPAKTGVLLPANATIEFQMHYTTAGRATTDASQIGLYLHKDKPEHELKSLILLNPRINIPAGAANHSDMAQRVIDRDIMVYSLLPHAHYRGKASEFVAHYPDGREEKLLSVPRYDFNWQTTYTLEQPKRLPAGTRIVHRTWWDNSVRNPANPDASRSVPWGEQSFDEMLFGAIRYRELDTVAAIGPTVGED
ncbi:MAG: redoxin domain-containing protein [Candidatus Azotimanducaceae bacterium]